MPGTFKQQLGVKIIREDFLIEILGVPISLPVQHGREADNTENMKKTKQGTERIIPCFDKRGGKVARSGGPLLGKCEK